MSGPNDPASDLAAGYAALGYKALMAATNKYNQFAAMAQQALEELQQAQRDAGEMLENWLVTRGDLPEPATGPTVTAVPDLATMAGVMQGEHEARPEEPAATERAAATYKTSQE